MEKFLTPEGFKKLKKELQHLKEVKRTANKQRRVTDRVGYPVAIGQMLPRILARIAGKS